jgi:hypothetical protein
MIRTGLLAVLFAGAASVLSSSTYAQERPFDNEDTRYTFHRAVDGGYLRLDGRTGQVSLCNRRQSGWVCQTVPDERAALEAEIARLQLDNAALKKELLAHNIELPQGVAPHRHTADKSKRLLPSDDDLDQVMGFIENVWRRLVEMIASVQRDVLKKS